MKDPKEQQRSTATSLDTMRRSRLILLTVPLVFVPSVLCFKRVKIIELVAVVCRRKLGGEIEDAGIKTLAGNNNRIPKRHVVCLERFCHICNTQEFGNFNSDLEHLVSNMVSQNENKTFKITQFGFC